MRGCAFRAYQRNRRTALRLVVAVLVFHGLALTSGFWVLHLATQGEPVKVAVAATPPAPVQQVPPSGGLDAATAAYEWPQWLQQAQRKDASAPWSIDATGHVLPSWHVR